MLKRLSFSFVGLALVLFFCSTAYAADTFRVATYNIENYLDQPTESRPYVKSSEARAKVRESIRTLNPDVLALEEMAPPTRCLNSAHRSRPKDWIIRIGNMFRAGTRTSTWLF